MTVPPFSDHISRYAFPFLTGSSETPAGRGELYDTLEWLYHNTLFEQMGLAALDAKLAEQAGTSSVRGIYNPVTRIVDCYREYTLGGRLGPEDDEQAEVHIRAENPAIVDPLLRLWAWSNMESQKTLLPYYAANLGDALLMPIVRPNREGVPGKAWLEIRHPGIIKDIRFDDRMNIVYARIETVKEPEPTVEEVVREIAGEARADREGPYLYTAIYTKTQFATLRDGKPFDYTGTGAPAVWDNPWGFVPLLLCQHKPTGGEWGLNAYHSSVPAISEMCLDASICGQLLGLWLAPQWAIFGVGRTQQKVRRDGPAWLFEEKGDAKALVADVDFAGAYKHIGEMMHFVTDEQPELSLGRVREAGLETGEAIRAMLFDLVRKLEMAQDQYDAALVRGFQMLLTMAADPDGSGNALEGFGGLGSYEDGSYNFAFARPDILAPSKLEQARTEAEIGQIARQKELAATGATGGAGTSAANDSAALLASRLLNGASASLNGVGNA